MIISTREQIDELFRQVHTVKGNGGSFGFNEVSRVAGFAEDFLEEAKSIEEFTDNHKTNLNNALQLMQEELEGINSMKAKLFSDKEDSMTISRKTVPKIAKFSAKRHDYQYRRNL